MRAIALPRSARPRWPIGAEDSLIALVGAGSHGMLGNGLVEDHEDQQHGQVHERREQ